MTKYEALAIVTKYWRPKENYLEKIAKAGEKKVVDGYFVVVSEKAISTASGNIVDEGRASPGLSARFIAKFWMRVIWGHFLGFLCHFRHRLLLQMRRYPFEMGSKHKQIALQHAGLLQSLMFGSEGGIDGSNLPYSYVSLPLKNSDVIAEEIRRHIWSVTRKKVFVMIVDTDKTYSFRNFHFTPRPKPFKGIHSFGGIVAFVFGRMLRFEKRATPLAVAGCRIPVETALKVAEIANRSRGFGSGRTVWDMADKFNVDLAGVSWEMLETVKHKPIVIVRTKR